MQPYCGEDVLDAPHSSGTRLIVGTGFSTDVHVHVTYLVTIPRGGDKGGRKCWRCGRREV
jgi:hypothetical protein